MTQPFIRKDMKPLAEELGVAPNKDQRMVEIDRSIYEEFMGVAKRRYSTVKAEINGALSQWLGRAQ